LKTHTDTFWLVFSSTPLILCLCDYAFLPSVSSAGYAFFDHAFDICAYSCGLFIYGLRSRRDRKDGRYCCSHALSASASAFCLRYALDMFGHT
jgi:hypothetical protein